MRKFAGKVSVKIVFLIRNLQALLIFWEDYFAVPTYISPDYLLLWYCLFIKRERRGVCVCWGRRKERTPQRNWQLPRPRSRCPENNKISIFYDPTLTSFSSTWIIGGWSWAALRNETRRLIALIKVSLASRPKPTSPDKDQQRRCEGRCEPAWPGGKALAPLLLSGRTPGSTSRFGTPFSPQKCWFMDTVSWLCPTGTINENSKMVDNAAHLNAEIILVVTV